MRITVNVTSVAVITTVLCATLLAAGRVCVAQTAVAGSLTYSAELPERWRYQQGDNGQWSRPDFDDSGWREVNIKENPIKQGITPLSSFAWYRVKLPRPDAHAPTPFGISVGELYYGRYEIYANGRLITPAQQLDADTNLRFPFPAIVAIPDDLLGSEPELSLAVRVWMPSAFTKRACTGFSDGIFLIGSVSRLSDAAKLRRSALLNSNLPSMILGLLFTIVGLYHLLIYYKLRAEKEYLRYGLVAVSFALQAFMAARPWAVLITDNIGHIITINLVAGKLTSCFVIEFLWPFLGRPINRWLRAFQAFNLINAVLVIFVPFNIVMLSEYYSYAPLSVLLLTLITGLIIQEAWRGNPEARTLLVGTISYFIALIVQVAAGVTLVQWAFALNVVLMAVCVANRFARVYTALNELNRDLEAKVAARTAEVSEKNAELQLRLEEIAFKNQELIKSNQRADRIFSALSEALPGKVLDGKYRLEEMIGSGGFASVYRATHLTMKRDVAVKIFKPMPGNDSAENLERFQLEAITASRVNHANAVAILDSGISSDGIAYMVMELLKGYTLTKELQMNGALSIARTVEILQPVCEVLALAHAMGLVHRDIKPDNIFLHQSDEGEVVKLVDFGIAKLVENTASFAIRDLTATGGLIGTPTYMSPERIDNKPYDGRSDIYSLGVVVYQMLSGRLPFELTESGMVGIFLQHLTQPPPSFQQINIEVPAELADLIMSMLAKKPDDRPTAAALCAALAKFATLRQDAAATIAKIKATPSFSKKRHTAEINEQPTVKFHHRDTEDNKQ